jgi:hypothetical protein
MVIFTFTNPKRIFANAACNSNDIQTTTAGIKVVWTKKSSRSGTWCPHPRILVSLAFFFFFCEHQLFLSNNLVFI